MDESLISYSIGTPHGATGVGSLLILEYQKSGASHTGCPMKRWTFEQFFRPVKSKPPQSTQVQTKARVRPQPRAQWLALAADDFWYSSMRRPPMTAAARVQATTVFNVYLFT